MFISSSIIMRYVHMLVTTTLFGKNVGFNALYKRELFVLWCIMNKRSVNLGAMLAEQMNRDYRRTKIQQLSFGHIVMHLVNTLCPEKLSELEFFHVETKTVPLDTYSLKVAGLIKA